MEWLDRYNALLEPTDMETAMRDEADLALASVLVAEVSPFPASILRVLEGAQSARLTAARMWLIQTVFTHGKDQNMLSVCLCVSLSLQTAGLACGIGDDEV